MQDRKEECSERPNGLHRFIFFAFGISGFAALVYEVVLTRKLSTVMGSSTYAVSTMLAAFMMGLAAGGFLGGKLIPRIKRPEIAFALCELGIGLAGITVIPFIEMLVPVYMASFYAFHLSFSSFSVVQFFINFSIMLLPTTLMGMTFPIVVAIHAKKPEDAGKQSGYLYGINTLGAVFGSVSAGFLLIPVLGIKGTVFIAASLNISVAIIILLLSRKMKHVLASIISVLAGLFAYAFLDRPAIPLFSYYYAHRFGSLEGIKRISEVLKYASVKDLILFHEEGVEGDIYLINSGEGYPVLINNGKLEAGEAIPFALLAYLPYFSYPAPDLPKKALNIGLGSGNTLSHLARLPIGQIDSVELSSGIIEVNRRILKPELFVDPRIKQIRADGRNFLLLSREAYDIIIASPSWAMEQASAGLLTDEFFQIAANRLTENGVFALWVDFFMLPDEEMEVLVRTFSRHFRHITAWYAEVDNIILTGTNSDVTNSYEAVTEEISMLNPDYKGIFKVAMSEKDIRLLPQGAFNTDDRPVVEFANAKNFIRGPVNIYKESIAKKDSIWSTLRHRENG